MYATISTFLFTITFGLLFRVSPTLASELMKPELSVPIPNVKFTGESDGNTTTVNFIGEYISGLYTYLIGVATLAAIVMVMVSGLLWAFGAASSESISRAKSMMKNAITGLALLLGTHLLLVTINPKLVFFQPLTLDNVDYVSLIDSSGDAPGSLSTERLEEAGIDCPESGDIAQIAQSFVGKTTYRFGAKGGNPPYESETKTDPNGTAYGTYCPDGQVCLDCSGYVALVAHCAGLESMNESGGTAGIFENAPSIIECGEDWVATSDGESIELEPGDLIGFKNGDRENKSGGHVWMYIQNDTLINAVGRGRSSGTGVVTQSLQSACKSFPLRVVDRNP